MSKIFKPVATFTTFLCTLYRRIKAYWPEDSPRKSTNRIIAMYHSGASSNIMQHVLSSLRDPEGRVQRIVIATSALGIGVDMKGLHIESLTMVPQMT